VSAPLTLADLAGEGGVTPAHLIRLFRRDLGRTPRRELNRLRIRRAETLLVETGWTVGEIADRCGFADPPHFSRAFRKAYGKSPGEFRRQHWVLPEERNQPSCF
jgi:AraC-like DNA-binding protein